jgi:hypothetical protein
MDLLSAGAIYIMFFRIWSFAERKGKRLFFLSPSPNLHIFKFYLFSSTFSLHFLEPLLQFLKVGVHAVEFSEKDF